MNIEEKISTEGPESILWRRTKFLHLALDILKSHENGLSFKNVSAEVVKRLGPSFYTHGKTENWETELQLTMFSAANKSLINQVRDEWLITSIGKNLVKECEEAVFRQLLSIREVESFSAADTADSESNYDSHHEFSELQSLAFRAIKKHVLSLRGPKILELAAALLRAMGYHTQRPLTFELSESSQLVAYADPLGLNGYKVIAKVSPHGLMPVGNHEIASLKANLSGNNEKGLYIATGGFTDAVVQDSATRSGRIELVDLGRFLELWLQYYSKMNDDDKSLLPLAQVWCLTSR